jgi:nucleoside-diphosphate-sugar epimerase
VSKILAIVGSHAKVTVDSVRLRPKDSEVYRLLSDNGLARKALNWQPQTDLDHGLEATIAWIQKHLELYRVGAYEF